MHELRSSSQMTPYSDDILKQFSFIGWFFFGNDETALGSPSDVLYGLAFSLFFYHFLLDDSSIIILKYPFVLPKQTPGTREQFRFQHISIFCGIHHTLTDVHSSNTMRCHTATDHHTGWVLYGRQYTLRTEGFMRSSPYIIVSRVILCRKRVF